MSYPGHSFAGVVVLPPLQRCSQCILQPQPSGKTHERLIIVLSIFSLANHILPMFLDLHLTSAEKKTIYSIVFSLRPNQIAVVTDIFVYRVRKWQYLLYTNLTLSSSFMLGSEISCVRGRKRERESVKYCKGNAWLRYIIRYPWFFVLLARGIDIGTSLNPVTSVSYRASVVLYFSDAYSLF